MNKLESYITEICTKIKERYPEAVIEPSMKSYETADATIDIYLPHEVDEDFKSEISEREIEILLEDDLFILTFWFDTEQSWQWLMAQKGQIEQAASFA